jgi:hypothetical protein
VLQCQLNVLISCSATELRQRIASIASEETIVVDDSTRPVRSVQQRVSDHRKRAGTEQDDAAYVQFEKRAAQDRYFLRFSATNHFFRIPQLDAEFERLRQKQQNWLTPLANGADLYADFYHVFHSLTKNIVCASCGILGHDVGGFQSVPLSDGCLRLLSISPDIYVPFNFSSGQDLLDQDRVMIDREGLSTDGNLTICNKCHSSLQVGKCPDESLANFRWVGIVPDELQDLTWLEELLIARAHLVGRIVRLQERTATSYFALKGHTVLLPQDTTRLLHLLPMSISSLPDVVRVVWTGKSAPDKARLRSYFTVRPQRVYNALHWLCRNHEDYRHVTIDEERISLSKLTVVATELLDSIAHVADVSVKLDASRSGFATKDPDVQSFEGDIPFNVSGILDMNNITRAPEIVTLDVRYPYSDDDFRVLSRFLLVLGAT